MKMNRLALACVGIAVMTAPAVYGQQQPASDTTQGVSQPPPDDTIIATPETAPPDAPAAPQTNQAKPSPASLPSAQIATQPDTRPDPTPDKLDPNRFDNTDFGLVTSPAPVHVNADLDTSDDTQGAVLHTRETGDNDIVFPNPGSSNELPEGTRIRVRINEALSTTQTTAGTPFHGQIVLNVTHNGSVIIPAGTTLRGRVVQVSQGHHFGPAATLRLRPDTVILPDGTAYHLYAQVQSSEADGTRIGSEGGIQPDAHVVKKTLEYGLGVGTGALVGAEVGGPPGAMVGSLVGAGVVTIHLLLQHPEAAVVPAGSEIVFSLTEPLDLTPTRN